MILITPLSSWILGLIFQIQTSPFLFYIFYPLLVYIIIFKDGPQDCQDLIHNSLGPIKSHGREKKTRHCIVKVERHTQVFWLYCMVCVQCKYSVREDEGIKSHKKGPCKKAIKFFIHSKLFCGLTLKLLLEVCFSSNTLIKRWNNKSWTTLRPQNIRGGLHGWEWETCFL